MQFDNFGSDGQTKATPTAYAPTAPPIPAPASAGTGGNAPVGSSAERFAALCSSVDAAVKGDYTVPLPLDGNDRLTLLARHLCKLFERASAHDAPAPSAKTTAADSAPSHDLARDNARLKYLIANTPAIIYSSVPTGDGTMTFVSDNALRVLDYKPEEMVADPSFWFDHIHPDDVPIIFSSSAKSSRKASRPMNTAFAPGTTSTCGCTTACA